jgi:hypothetical protein
MGQGEDQLPASRLEVLGCPLDVVSMDQTVARCERAIGSGR